MHALHPNIFFNFARIISLHFSHLCTHYMPTFSLRLYALGANILLLVEGTAIIFSVTLQSQNINISENPKIRVQFCLKLFYQCSKGKHKCLGLQTTRMEMDSNLK